MVLIDLGLKYMFLVLHEAPRAERVKELHRMNIYVDVGTVRQRGCRVGAATRCGRRAACWDGSPQQLGTESAWGELEKGD